MRPFIERYPLFLRRSPEFRDLQWALEPELLELWEARDGALAQLCVETASWGLRYWEQTLGIPSEKERSLEARRSRVRSRLMGADVTTVSLVESVTKVHTGIPADVVEYPERFWVELLFDESGGLPRDLEDLVEALREIMPAHLGWGFRFSLGAEGRLCVGGAFASILTLPIQEAPDGMKWKDTARVGGKGAVVSILPVPKKA